MSIEVTTTTIVEPIISGLLGQVTFFSSSFVSSKYLMIFSFKFIS